MIALLNARATSPKNRRYPLSILALASMIEGKEEYEIVDGNLDPNPLGTLDRMMRETGIELLAATVMPGPQMISTIPICREFRSKYPSVPIIWGGYFPSLYPDAALNAPYVDFLGRGQGEEIFVEWIEALRTTRDYSRIRGLSYKNAGRPQHNAERPLRSLDDFPWLPYHRLDAEKYILPTFLGSRTAVHHASIGCPYRCNFCGVISVHGSREKFESPERTASVLGHLKQRYAVNAVQFYDNNFFLREDQAADLAARLEPLALRWWCEARVDIMLRYSDSTLKALRRAGATMIFFGSESGSDWVLEQMQKDLKAHQTLELAERIRRFGIIPEFSFVLGNPQDPERETRECIAFVRKVKKLNPEAEIIIQHYTPTPQRGGMYGGVDDRMNFPRSPEEWATGHWSRFTVREDTQVAWLPKKIKNRIDDFETVVNARWPTIQDIRLPRWGRALLKGVSSWRYASGFHKFPYELQWLQKYINLRKPRAESL